MSLTRTHLTVIESSGAFSIGATTDAPGHYPPAEDSGDAPAVVVEGAYNTAPEIRAAWVVQFGTPCPV